MKKRPIKYFTLIFIIGMGLVHPLMSQEGGLRFHDEEPQEEINAAGAEGSYHYSERQNDEQNNQVKTVTKPTAKKLKETYKKPVSKENHAGERQKDVTIESQDKKEDSDSVLSFNFLHYIIQKFKFSDVIDQ